MGNVSPTSARPTASNFKSVESRSEGRGSVYSGDSLEMVSFLFNEHNVTQNRDLRFFLQFRGSVQDKGIIKQKFINAASTEAQLEQCIAQLRSVDTSKLSPKELKQYNAELAEAEKALEAIKVDTVLNKMSHNPQNRESITQEFDRNVATAATLSETLARTIDQFRNNGFLQPQQKAPADTTSDSRGSTTASQQKVEFSRDNKKQEGVLSHETEANLNIESAQRQNAEHAKESERLQKLQGQYAADRKKEAAGGHAAAV